MLCYALLLFLLLHFSILRLFIDIMCPVGVLSVKGEGMIRTFYLPTEGGHDDGASLSDSSGDAGGGPAPDTRPLDPATNMK